MNILFIGDIFASAGRGIVADHLQKIITEEKISLAIANVENSAGGFGVTPSIAEEMLSLGLDVLTTGNHVWDKRELYDYLPRQERLLRPANYSETLPGTGIWLGKARNGVPCAVINMQGRSYMPSTDDPFRKMDTLLAGLPEEVKVVFVDFHAELTSEKVAMGWYLDGRVSAMIGTHTHIPTADERILPGGTAYQTITERQPQRNVVEAAAFLPSRDVEEINSFKFPIRVSTVLWRCSPRKISWLGGRSCFIRASKAASRRMEFWLASKAAARSQLTRCL